MHEQLTQRAPFYSNTNSNYWVLNPFKTAHGRSAYSESQLSVQAYTWITWAQSFQDLLDGSYWLTGHCELLSLRLSVRHLSAFPHVVGKTPWLAPIWRVAAKAWKVVSTISHFGRGPPCAIISPCAQTRKAAKSWSLLYVATAQHMEVWQWVRGNKCRVFLCALLNIL